MSCTPPQTHIEKIRTYFSVCKCRSWHRTMHCFSSPHLRTYFSFKPFFVVNQSDKMSLRFLGDFLKDRSSLTYIQKNRGFMGCFEEWFTTCLQNSSSRYPNRWISRKTLLTYMNKIGLLYPLFWKIFTDCLQTSSLNSHRKLKNAHSSKNISHLYPRKSDFRDHVSNRIYTIFTNTPLIFKDKKQPFCRVGYNFFTFFTIADNSPSLISCQKSKSLGFIKKTFLTYMNFWGGIGNLF